MSFAVLSRKGENASAAKTKAAFPALRTVEPVDPLSRDAGRDETWATGEVAKPQWSLSGMTIERPRQSAVRAIQTKLAINDPGDQYEQEADKMEDRIMRMPEPQLGRSCACAGRCPACQVDQPSHERKRLQTKRVEPAGAERTIPPVVNEVLRSPGNPLDSETRKSFEGKFGHNFGNVRVHCDGASVASARALNAQAYTVGHHVVFGEHYYSPSSLSGRTLLAHELTHVLQQTSSSNPGRAAATLQRKPENSGNAQKAEREFKKSKEWLEYVRTFRELQESNARLAKEQAEEDAALARLAAAKDRLAQVTRRNDEMKRQLAIVRVNAFTKHALAQQAAKRAVDAAIAADKSRASARRWTRFAAIMKGAFNSLELAISCPLAETGLGAIACIHATTSLHADLTELSTGDLTPNLFTRAGHDVTKAFGASERQANLAGAFTDAAGGGISGAASVSDEAFAAVLSRTAYSRAIPAPSSAYQAAGTATQSVDGAIIEGPAATTGSPLKGNSPATLEDILSQVSATAAGPARAQGTTGLFATARKLLLTARFRVGEPILRGASEHNIYNPGGSSAVGELSIGARGPSSTAPSAAVSTPTSPITPAFPAAPVSSIFQQPIARGPEVFQELSAELGLNTASAPQAGVRAAVSDALAGGLIGPQGASGTVDVAFQRHGHASDARGAYGVTGQQQQSAHIGPTAFLRNIPGYSRSGALTDLLDPATHRAFDDQWKSWAIAQRRAGRTECSVGELRQVMFRAILGIPNISQRVQGLLTWRLALELHELGLSLDDVVDLPYANVNATGTP
jgi:hypothetical protein